MLRTAVLLATATLAGCSGPDRADRTDVEATGMTAEAGWTDLFDGATLDGWHGYAASAPPPAWTVERGVLTFTPGGDGGDLVAPGTWADFELEVEWQIAPCGNSGVFYRGQEAPGLAPIWRTSLEAQVLDDSCNPDGVYPSHRAGSLYDLYAAAPGPSATAASTSGGWRTLRVVADGDRIEHWLDGQRVVEARQGSAEWDARLAVSKFRDGTAFPGYGTRRAGLIGLQDHGDTLRVRAVRVRPL